MRLRILLRRLMLRLYLARKLGAARRRLGRARDALRDLDGLEAE